VTGDNPIQGIVKQQLALDIYLRTLLEQIPDIDIAEDVSTTAISVAVESPEAIVESVDEIKPSQPLIEVLAPTVPELPKQTLVSPENPVKLQPLSVMPEWAQHDFQALFFKVDHMLLATPLTSLLRTIKFDRKAASIPGQPSWFLGLMDEHDSRIGVLDTGQLIFGKSRGSQRDLIDKPYQRILITHDKKWGLACDEILSIGRINPEQVRWRTIRQRKPWLIGAVIEELAAVVDINYLVPRQKE
jgi:purine-binding chemotaxis protein CheW